MKYDHYILTRWNYGVYDKRDDPNEWTYNRAEVFERYCLPSILRQTCTDFTWVLAFDEQTPTDIICRYDYIDNVRVIYESPYHWIRRSADPSRWLITTRLDNDDYVERDWVANIQSVFAEDVALVDTLGRAYHQATDTYYDPKRRVPNSPFLSLIEPGDRCKTCYETTHTDMAERYPGIIIPEYGWTFVVHSDNIRNHIHPHFTPDVPQERYANG